MSSPHSISQLESTYVSLMRGLKELDLRGPSVPCDLILTGDNAFPLAMNSHGQVLLAASMYGSGRIVVLGHEAFMSTLPNFITNAIHWLKEDKSEDVSVGVHVRSKHVIEKVQSKFQFKFMDDFSSNKGIGVYVTDAYSVEDKAKDIIDFMKSGGGVLIAGQAWSWAEGNPKVNTLLQFPGNKVSGVAGVYFSKHRGDAECNPVYPKIPDSWMSVVCSQGVRRPAKRPSPGNKILNKMGLTLLSKYITAGSYKAPVPCEALKKTYNFRHALQKFAGHVTKGEKLAEQEEAWLNKLSLDCGTFLHMDSGNNNYKQILSTFTEILKKGGMPQVCESCPVKTARDKLILNVATDVYKVHPNKDELLSYLIKDDPLLPVVYNHKVRIDVDTADAVEWVSTGLYLTPGMKTYMSIPESILNKGWKVQVGCQTDNLNNAKELKRAPCVCEHFPVTAEMMLVHHLWGGLIYLVAPPKTQVTGAEVIVQMAVPAPYYKSGVTSMEAWQLLRTAPSPWAELEFENIILMVPSDEVRSLDRPDELAAVWDKIMRAIADLASIPHKFKRKERFLCDVQISHGNNTMHKCLILLHYGHFILDFLYFLIFSR
ncbi:TRPM8 channel-associated factor homolog [Eucyclogobius newberryi]|uniref:TRPM8 channel-associated factor homolog n=1 Tax=Eucyclogobius newberryi TaxID=166745 RepID=UPI003B58EEAA